MRKTLPLIAVILGLPFPQLTWAGPDGGCLASGCHEKTKEQISTATHQHSLMSENKACLNCHKPHDPKQPIPKELKKSNLLKVSAERLCLDCHDKAITTPKGDSLPNIAALIKNAKSVHTPLKNGKCTGCHQPHGSKGHDLIDSALSFDLHGKFSTERFQLCFDCHDVELATVASTKSNTKFRNGTTNLHYLHMQRDKKGLSCVTCHDVHASDQDFQMSSSFKYAGVEAPIQFKKTENGGNCTTICHGNKKYNRERMESNAAGR